MDPDLVAKIKSNALLSLRPLSDPDAEEERGETVLATGPFVTEYGGLASTGALLRLGHDGEALLWQSGYSVAERPSDKVRLVGNTVVIGSGERKVVIRPFQPEDVALVPAPLPDLGATIDALYGVLTGGLYG